MTRIGKLGYLKDADVHTAVTMVGKLDYLQAADVHTAVTMIGKLMLVCILHNLCRIQGLVYTAVI